MRTSNLVPSTTHQQHRSENRRQSTLLVLSLAAIVGVCGFALAGPLGIFGSLVAIALVAFGNTRVAASAILRLYDARALRPENAPDLHKLFVALVQRARIAPLPRLYYVPSQTINAFAVGTGSQASVAVTDGLLRQLNPRELAGVLAHELSHIRHNDLVVMGLADGLSRVTTILGQVGQLLVLLSIPAYFMGYEFPLFAALVLFFALGASALLQLALSRTREYHADAGAAEITGDPMGLASALARIEHSQGSWFERVFMPGRRDTQPALLRTHPATGDRINRLRELAGERPASTLPAPERLTTSLGPPLRPRWHVLGLWY
ncbi:MAG: zinc metalloprotease HtpX [Pseudomonadota bacterium]